MRAEHDYKKFESAPWREYLLPHHEFALFNQLQIQDVIHEAEEQVDLRGDNLEHTASIRGELLHEQTLQEHEACSERVFELLRDLHLVVHQRLVSVLLLLHLALKLE